MDVSPLHERLRAAVGNKSYRQIGELTGTHAETTRRYMLGYAPSAEFLSAVCQVFAINGEWLLTGRGPMRRADVKRQALEESRAGELLTALATAVERMNERLERVEVFVQMLETRVRAMQTPAHLSTAGSTTRSENDGQQAGTQVHAAHQPLGHEDGRAHGQGGRADGSGDARAGAGSPAHVVARTQLVADAVAQRPSPPAG